MPASVLQGDVLLQFRADPGQELRLLSDYSVGNDAYARHFAQILRRFTDADRARIRVLEYCSEERTATKDITKYLPGVRASRAALVGGRLPSDEASNTTDVDVVCALWLFSVQSAVDFRVWIEALGKKMAPDGCLVFSTKGLTRGFVEGLVRERLGAVSVVFAEGIWWNRDVYVVRRVLRLAA